MLNYSDFISENILLKEDYSSIEEYLIDKGFFEKSGLWNYIGPKGYIVGTANVIIEQKYFDLLLNNGELKINFGEINGSLIISPNDKTQKITSLKGFEHIDCIDLDLSGNAIENVESIGTFKNLNISHNSITSLKGLPEVIDGYLDVSNNNIKDLINGPKEINSFFDVSNNELINLEGCPIVKGTFIVSQNINTFYGLKEINRSLNIDRNFDKVPKEEVKFLKSLKNGHVFKDYVLELIEYTIKEYGSNNVANLNIPDKEIGRLPEDIKNLLKSSKGLKKFNI